jgi:antitoxin MazE
MTAGTHLAGAALTASLLRGFGVEGGLIEGLAFAPGIGPASRQPAGSPPGRGSPARPLPRASAVREEYTNGYTEAMRTRVARWGHSLAVRIPKPLAEATGLRLGEEVILEVGGEGLVLRPLRLDDLLEAITEANRHEEVDWGPATGREA